MRFARGSKGKIEIEEGNRQITEGTRLYNESERIFREKYPDLKLDIKEKFFTELLRKYFLKILKSIMMFM